MSIDTNTVIAPSPRRDRAAVYWSLDRWVVELGKGFEASNLRAAMAATRNSGAVPRRDPALDRNAPTAVVFDYEAGARWDSVPAARAGETPYRYARRIVRWVRQKDARLVPHAEPGGAAVTIRVPGAASVYLTVRASEE